LQTPRTVDAEADDIMEEVVGVNRVAKVVKGGRNFRFNAAVVVGDGKGNVAGAVGKAQEIAEAIRKASSRARKSMRKIPRVGTTVPHAMWCRFGGARVLLKPASPGTGIVAGDVVRSIMQCAGIGDVVSKCLGSTNPINVMRATINALYLMKSPEEVRQLRGRLDVRASHEAIEADADADNQVPPDAIEETVKQEEESEEDEA